MKHYVESLPELVADLERLGHLKSECLHVVFNEGDLLQLLTEELIMEQQPLPVPIAQQAINQIVKFTRVKAWFLRMKRPQASFIKLPSVGVVEDLLSLDSCRGSHAGFCS